MFNRRTQVYLQALMALLSVYFLVRISGTDTTTAICWGIFVGLVFLLWRRQEAMVDSNVDVFEGTIVADLLHLDFPPPELPPNPYVTMPVPEAPTEATPEPAPVAQAPVATANADQPDDLKLISGVGPALEKHLNEMGIFHFKQIAGWSAEELKQMDESLPRLKGRASRDDWIGQARTLMTGGSGD